MGMKSIKLVNKCFLLSLLQKLGYEYHFTDCRYWPFFSFPMFTCLSAPTFIGIYVFPSQDMQCSQMSEFPPVGRSWEGAAIFSLCDGKAILSSCGRTLGGRRLLADWLVKKWLAVQCQTEPGTPIISRYTATNAQSALPTIYIYHETTYEKARAKFITEASAETLITWLAYISV